MTWRKRCSVGLAGFMAAALMTSVARAEDPKPGAEIGKKAPDFTLSSADGKEVKLADFAGKVVVLEWTNFECPVVQRYVVKQKSMQKTYDQFKDKGVVWLAIDSTAAHKKEQPGAKEHVERNGIKYPYLFDPDGKVGHAFGAKTTPHMFVIDKKGNLAYMGSMDDDEKGGKENAKNYVADALTSLLGDSTVATSKTTPFGCSVKYKKD